MKIQVTEEDIAKGERCSSAFCPIARAVKRVLGKDCAVGSATMTVFTPVKHEDFSAADFYELPPEARDFIRRFDSFDDEAVTPFEFELKPKEETCSKT